MQTNTLILILILSLATLGLLGLWLLVWVGRLLKHTKKAAVVNHDILTADERRELKKQAAAQYEAALVRELKQFEGQLTNLSSSLLAELKADVKSSDQAVTQAAAQLTTQLSEQYTSLLTQATTQLQTHLSTVEQELTKETTALQESLQATTEARRQVVLKRVDTELADILSQYMNATLEQLDLTDQEQFILAKLEAIKPQLKEDLSRVK